MLALLTGAGVLALLFSFSWQRDRWQHLRSMSEVAKVESNQPPSPIATIIHVRDWHFVPFDQFAADMEDASKRKLTERELADLWKDYLDLVEKVQIEQMEVLRMLAVRQVFSEGLFAEAMPGFMVKIDLLREHEAEMPTLRQQLSELETILAIATGDRRTKAEKIRREIQTLVDTHRMMLLEIGTPGRLLLAGDIDRILPLEDEQLLQDANPIKGGKIAFDSAKVRARRDAMIRNLRVGPEPAVVILGGSHILEMPAGVEYVRVTVKAYPTE